MSNGINTALVTWAWEAMWNPKLPYYLPNILLNGLQSGNIHINSANDLLISQLSFPDLLDKAPWGTIGVDLSQNTLQGISTMAPSPDAASSFTYDENSGDFTAKISFGQINLSGNYDAKTGGLLGCAVDVAAIGGKIIDPVNKSALRATAANDAVPPLDSARNYRTQLLQSDNGSTMVQTYYENNDTYAELFADPTYKSFQQVWAEHTTAGQTTQYYGLQTNTAVQPANAGTVPINGQPDSQGQSPYNSHSYFMQTFLMGYCFKAANYYGTQTEKGKRFNKAGSDAVQFGDTTKTTSGKPMTANDVMNTVASTPALAHSAHVLHTSAPPPDANSPLWLRNIHDTATSMAEQAAAQDLGHGERRALGDTGLTISGSYSDTLSSAILTLKGVITFQGANVTVAFSSISGDLGDVSIVLSKPTGVNSDLFTAIAQAIANTSWVKGTLKTAITNKLSSPDLLTTLNQAMQTAITKALG